MAWFTGEYLVPQLLGSFEFARLIPLAIILTTILYIYFHGQRYTKKLERKIDRDKEVMNKFISMYEELLRVCSEGVKFSSNGKRVGVVLSHLRGVLESLKDPT